MRAGNDRPIFFDRASREGAGASSQIRPIAKIVLQTETEAQMDDILTTLRRAVERYTVRRNQHAA
jgi:hypothetical protein